MVVREEPGWVEALREHERDRGKRVLDDEGVGGWLALACERAERARPAERVPVHDDLGERVRRADVLEDSGVILHQAWLSGTGVSREVIGPWGDDEELDGWHGR